MVTVTKCGCTFLQSLFLHINEGGAQSGPMLVHGPDASPLLRADEDEVEKIAASPYRFMVVRDPVDRFISLYFDKIANPERKKNFLFLRNVLKPLGMRFGRKPGLEAHRANMLILIDWFELNIAGKTDRPVNFHWRPQMRKYNRVKKLDPVLIPLECLNEALPALLEPVIPDIREKMEAVKSRNPSPKPYSHAELRTEALVKRIREVYHKDAALVEKARETWKERLSEIRSGASDLP